MDNIFIIRTAKERMIIYMDDMLIFAKTKEELTKRTLEVLQLLRENDLYLKPQKCKFCVKKIDFLGFIIEDGKWRWTLLNSLALLIGQYRPPFVNSDLFLGLETSTENSYIITPTLLDL